MMPSLLFGPCCGLDCVSVERSLVPCENSSVRRRVACVERCPADRSFGPTASIPRRSCGLLLRAYGLDPTSVLRTAPSGLRPRSHVALDPAHVQVVELSPLDERGDAPSLVASKEDEVTLLPGVHEDILRKGLERRRAPPGTRAELQLAALELDDERATGPVSVGRRIVGDWQVADLEPRRRGRQGDRLHRRQPPVAALVHEYECREIADGELLLEDLLLLEHLAVENCRTLVAVHVRVTNLHLDHE